MVGKKIVFILLMISVFGLNLYSSESHEFYGDKFRKAGEQYRAITEYYLAIFNKTNNCEKADLYIKIAESYLLAKQNKSVLENYDKADSLCKEKHDYILFLRGRYFFARGSYQLASMVWRRMTNNKRRELVLGLSKGLEGSKDEARDYLLRYADKNKGAASKIKGIIDYMSSHNVKRKSPLLALGLSALIPGAGQIYTAHYGEAGMSLVVNGIFAFLAYNALQRAKRIPNYGYTEFGFWSFVGFGFYTGNLYGAALSAQRYNINQVQIYQTGLIKEIKSSGFSLKIDF